MAVTKIRKMSSWTLLAISLISVAIFAMFYLGGVGEPYNGQMKNPLYTGELLAWMYILFGICAASLLLFGIAQFFGKFKANPKNAITSLAVLILFALLLVVAYVSGDGTALTSINADSAQYNTENWLKITDMWLYTIYALSVLAICAMGFGSIKKIMNK